MWQPNNQSQRVAAGGVVLRLQRLNRKEKAKKQKTRVGEKMAMWGPEEGRNFPPTTVETIHQSNGLEEERQGKAGAPDGRGVPNAEQGRPERSSDASRSRCKLPRGGIQEEEVPPSKHMSIQGASKGERRRGKGTRPGNEALTINTPQKPFEKITCRRINPWDGSS